MDIGKVNGLKPSPASPDQAGTPGEKARAAGAPPLPEREAKREADPETVRQAVGRLNELFLIFDTSIKFSVDEGLGNFRVKVIDNRNQEVIREYPPEKAIDVLNRIRDAVGVLVDETI